MKNFVLSLLPTMSFVVYPSYAVDFWHSSTVFANQGQCSALFSFDSGMEEIKNLQVTVSAVNKSGKKVASGILEIQEFGGSTADRYSQAFLEGEELCADDLTIVVSKATAIINGKQVDLLKTKMLSARNFKPFKIHLGK